MEIQLPPQDDIHNAYQQGEEAVVRLVEDLIGTIYMRVGINQKLNDQVSKNSKNSSLPWSKN